ncbi:probable sugar phosphate/phosphate translocator At2g25520 [Salvia miltiorrhiza]|uniref:probable sugar phosphate/phosphate translocator At2g25520 n=1 Tax=Salvia miltiorrhiza TaxID=226208 RepID=UPI0025AD9087|nr:probable sugar phosphate/phosphate translocator At2g25520 [Salvia miltiorrhiza]
MANMIPRIAAYCEAKFDSWGLIMQFAAVAFKTTRLIMIQILLTSKGITLNLITYLYCVALCCLVFLWIFVEFLILRENSSFHFDCVIFGSNSLYKFALNLNMFLLVGKTFALTMNVASVVKDWFLQEELIGVKCV